MSGGRTLARVTGDKVSRAWLARMLERSAPMQREPHPLAHHPSFRAVIEAAPALAELSLALRETELVSQLAIACGDLADGFAAPPDSRRRLVAHRRAWVAVRDLDRRITALKRRRIAPPAVVIRAQRAIDRADVMIGALLPG